MAPDVAIEVVPNGVDIGRFRPHRVDAPSPDRANLLYVGRLRDFKRVQDIIESMPRIQTELARPVRLVVAGSGPYREALERLVSILQVDVRFAGWLDKEALGALYEEADLLLLPSLVEGHPNVLLEAMAMARPCVATDVPGTREALRDGREGFLVPPCRPDEIARAAIRILSSAETWREFSRNARARAEASSWERVADRYEALLKQVAEGKAS